MSTNQTSSSPWTPPGTAGIKTFPASPVLISPQMSIGTVHPLPDSKNSTYATSKLYAMSFLVLSGAPPGIMYKSFVKQIIWSHFICFPMGDPVTTCVCKWPVQLHHLKSLMSLSGNRSGSPPTITYSQTSCLGGRLRPTGTFFMQSVPTSVSTRRSWTCVRSILHFNFNLTWAPSAGFIRVLQQHWRVLEQHPWAPCTCKALNSEKKAFVKFCLLADIEFLPVSGDILCLYAVWLWITKRLKAPRSVRN